MKTSSSALVATHATPLMQDVVAFEKTEEPTDDVEAMLLKNPLNACRKILAEATLTSFYFNPIFQRLQGCAASYAHVCICARVAPVVGISM